jgi:AcrR family transcriptional regulator
MGRQRQPEIAERLLEACTDAVLAGGLPDRLEPFATATGTSTRMLLYHFGTKDALLRAVLQRARARQRRDWEALLCVRPDEDYRTTLARAWAGMTGPAGQRYLAVFTRLRDDADQQLWPGFRREATTDWLTPLQEGLRTIGRPELATLVLAVVRGLIVDLDATGDTERVDAAFAAFLTSLADPPGSSGRPPTSAP